MSDLEAAIAAASKRAQREARCQVRRYGTDEEPVWGCWEHGRISYVREECAVIGPAVAESVRAGWDAAINAAAEKVQEEINRATQEQARIAPSEVGHYRANGGVVTGFRIRDAITALLPKGGNRD